MPLKTASTQQFENIPASVDLLLCACGYESRAIHVASRASTLARRKLAFGFDSQHELYYEQNKAWFQSQGFVVRDVSDTEFDLHIQQAISDACVATATPMVVVDVSCMNRVRLAHLVNALNSSTANVIDVMFAYNLAEYSAPSLDEAPTSVAEPVIPEFAGWTTYPERPPAALIGLGYEQSRAIGIVDHLEINNAAWAFIPRGPIDEYSTSVDTANQSLFDMIHVDGRKILYDVMNPASLFREVNSLVELLKQIYNPILIPFGPKIFALVSLLVASLHGEVGVWRVSSGTMGKATERAASSYTTVLRTTFQRDAERT
ncbi:hypothetical protein JM946_14230 [Steroidobacter sp. S1-65]|uniref:Uncharacterized protein n=1 Tax=Steroidobacter gossypii TaxID=2805490 RepID=A0ABS1WY35_9GAMM|nr:hypothetical protein [Steroidobacter gossypii]MBM0105885.1 hypothetical protein [Steroidobacter gossypii]